MNQYIQELKALDQAATPGPWEEGAATIYIRDPETRFARPIAYTKMVKGGFRKVYKVERDANTALLVKMRHLTKPLLALWEAANDHCEGMGRQEWADGVFEALAILNATAGKEFQ